MREIKFRAWHPPITDEGITLPGHMDYELVHQKLIAVRTETRMPPADFGFEHIQHGLYFINKDLANYGDRLMQFTVGQDKNLKDVYEGDILKFETLDSNNNIELTGVVEFTSKEFIAMVSGVGAYKFYKSYCEVIGNIYENQLEELI